MMLRCCLLLFRVKRPRYDGEVGHGQSNFCPLEPEAETLKQNCNPLWILLWKLHQCRKRGVIVLCPTWMISLSLCKIVQIPSPALVMVAHILLKSRVEALFHPFLLYYFERITFWYSILPHSKHMVVVPCSCCSSCCSCSCCCCCCCCGFRSLWSHIRNVSKLGTNPHQSSGAVWLFIPTQQFSSRALFKHMLHVMFNLSGLQTLSLFDWYTCSRRCWPGWASNGLRFCFSRCNFFNNVHAPCVHNRTFIFDIGRRVKASSAEHPRESINMH